MYETDTGADPMHELLKEGGEWEKAIAAKPMRQNLNIYINLSTSIKLKCCFVSYSNASIFASLTLS